MGRGAPLIRQWNLLKTLQAYRFGVATDELAECPCRRRKRPPTGRESWFRPPRAASEPEAATIEKKPARPS